MPLYAFYEETGTLMEDSVPGMLKLRRDDGGVWRLDSSLAARRLIGQRVHVRGKRSDFDMLDVYTITPA